MNENIEYFNQAALNWDNDLKRVERAKVVAGEMKRVIPNMEKMNALDYGCGTGLLSFNLHTCLKHITLADNSEGMLQVLLQKIKDSSILNMTPVKLDLCAGEILDERFDLVYTMMVLHHIEDTDRILEAFAGLVNPSGYLCIIDLDEEDGSFHGKDFTGHQGFNREKLGNLLNKHGFELITVETCYDNRRKIADGTEKVFPLFLMVGRKR